MDIKEIQEQAYQRGIAEGRRQCLMNELEKTPTVFCDWTVSCEDPTVKYVDLPDGLRLIIREGKYVGWYVCYGHKKPKSISALETDTKCGVAFTGMPVVRGRWEYHGGDDDLGLYGFCSNCQANWDEEVMEKFRYCPHCGAISNSHIYLEVIGNIHDNPELLNGGEKNE